MRFIFIIVGLCWLLSEIFLNRLARSKNPDSKERDRGSMQLIWTAIIFSIPAGILCAIYINARISGTLILPWIGLALILAGMAIRFIAIRTLGRFFTVNLAIHPDQHIIQTGPYRYIRHPSYAGSLLSFLGFALTLDNWLSLAVIVIPVFATFMNRILIEEKLLLQQFGQEYNEYMKGSGRLIPWVY